jgi:superfamily II DNA or RNA helicase
MKPGTIVRCRERDWVLLPSDNNDVYLLRPLAGTTDETVAVHRVLSQILGFRLPSEVVKQSVFPLPSEQDISDAAGAHLLWQAARLTLREGATPFRSLGRISIRPRIYQFVPLLMALRIDPVRLLIADDVGVGKTVEALLIARELFDRAEIKRMAVLCPPYLCDQWAAELEQKFNLEGVVIRSGTVSGLERHTPPGTSIYEYFPIQVISIDWVKTDRNKHQFLQFCPELVIVDEVHGAAEAATNSRGQQERHRLLQEISQNQNRHLILLTATPHSGIEQAFRSLLGLLKPEFQKWNIAELDKRKRTELAQHFVQRTRKDIEKDWEHEHCFPQRETSDETYDLSNLYRQLFESTYGFCSEIVRTGTEPGERQRRVRYWAALALLRCVMSSPAAAVAALEARVGGLGQVDEETEFSSYVFESAEDRTDDETPNPPVEAAEPTLPDSERRRLQKLARLAKALCGREDDTKLMRCGQVVRQLLQEGFHPIIWCRYVATAEYVSEHLRNVLPGDVQLVTVTGRIGDDERRVKIEEIAADKPRVLVATDCLSEGINLQDKFTAVLHYDLPWNPNRLEQREGRVDRYGQTARRVKAIRFYGRDNPVDGAVIEVLLDKAREIHRALGTHVPVPEESESVMQAVLNALFLRRKTREGLQQMSLIEVDKVSDLHQRWDRNAERERVNRTRFAQRAIKPDEVKRELEATDSVLGDPNAVREFVLSASQRIGLAVTAERRQGVFRVSLDPGAIATLPDPIRLALPVHSTLDARRSPFWLISFDSPTPEGAEYLGRNHRFVAALARFLLEDALTKPGNAIASRCGVLRTTAVKRLTTLLLLRVRYLIEQPQNTPLLSEEVVVLGYEQPVDGNTRSARWLSDDDALRLLAEAKPDANIPLAEKRELVRMVLGEIGEWDAGGTPRDYPGEWGDGQPTQQSIRQRIYERAYALEQSHKRIRRAVKLRVRELAVKPQFPPDLLGLLVLQPMVKP